MKTMSSHLLKGMIIVVVLLVLAQAWRVSRHDEAAADVPETTVTQESVEVNTPPSPRYQLRIPSEGSVEFVQELQRAHNPWKDAADPDHVWHSQRQRASELLIRHDMPPLDR